MFQNKDNQQVYITCYYQLLTGYAFSYIPVDYDVDAGANNK